MAEKNISMDEAFDFGIVDTSTMGNLKVVDSFLNDVPLEGEENLEEIDEQDELEKKKLEAKKKQLEEARKAALAKKEAEKKNKPSADKILFGEDEAEEDSEEEDKEEEDKEEGKDDNGEEGTTTDNPYEDFAKDLVKLGVLTQSSENEPLPKTGQELLEKFNQEKQAGAAQWLEGFLEKFGADRRELFDAIFVDGVEPREFLPLYTQIENMESLDISKEDNQEMVFREFYKRIKLPQDRIESKLQKAKDNGDLEADAKEFLEQLISQDRETAEEQRKTKAAKQQAEQRVEAEYKSALSKALIEKVKAKEINGIPVTQEIANKVFDFLHTKKYKTQDGQLLTEFDKFALETKRPENIEQRIMIALLKLTNFDFSKITKRAVSKQSSELFSTFAQKQAKKSAGAGKAPVASTESWLKL